MKPVKKVVMLLLIVSLMLSSFTGCNKSGGGKNNTSGNQSKTNSTPNDESSNTNNNTDNTDNIDSSDDLFDDISDDLSGDISDLSGLDDFVDTRTLFFDNANATNANFGGLSALYSGYNFHSDNNWDPYTDEELKWETDKVLNTGMSMVRANFYVSWVWDYKNNRYDYDTKDMEAFYRYANLMKANNIKLALVINDYQNTSFDGRKTPFVIISGGQDPDKCAEELGKFAADFVQEVVINRGFDNIEFFEVFTEPGNDVFGRGEEACKAEFDKQLKVFKAIHNTLTERGLRNRIKVIGPNVAVHHMAEPYITYASDWLKWTVQYANECLDLYSIHTYSRVTVSDDDYELWMDFLKMAKEIIEPTGKRLCIDEFGYADPRFDIKDYYNGPKYDPLSSMHLATAYIAFMNTGFVSDATIWSLADEKWPYTIKNSTEFMDGIQMTGFAIPNIRNSVRLKPAYYLLSVMGKTIKRGCKTFAGQSIESGVYGSFIENPDGSQSLVVINIGLTNTECTFEFAKSLGGAKLYKYVFNQEVKASKYDTPIETNQTFNFVQKGFKDTIESYSVVVYTTVKQ